LDFKSGGFKAAQAHLAAWWAEQKDGLVWDPAQRMFLLKR
jgi:hypothetical protein